MKFCKDCKHSFLPPPLDLNNALCRKYPHKDVIEFDPVTGGEPKPWELFFFCSILRGPPHMHAIPNACGPDGKYFEARE